MKLFWFYNVLFIYHRNYWKHSSMNTFCCILFWLRNFKQKKVLFMSLILWIHLMYTMFYFLAQLACETWFILIRGAIGSIFRCLHCFSVSTSLWFLRNRETDTPVKKLFKVKSKTCCCLILILSCCCFYKVELLFYKSQVIEILKYIRLIFFYNPCILDAFCRDNRYTILVLLACFVGSIFRLFYLLDNSQFYRIDPELGKKHCRQNILQYCL